MNDYLKKRQDYINAGRPLPEKKRKRIPPISEKRKAKLAEKKASGESCDMYAFFEVMRPRMTGKCLFCHEKSQAHDDATFHFSLAHLLPKAIFPSVSKHPKILIELCYYGNSCHKNFDDGMITWEMIRDSHEWYVIREQLVEVLRAVAPEERGHKLFSYLLNLVNRTDQR